MTISALPVSGGLARIRALVRPVLATGVPVQGLRLIDPSQLVALKAPQSLAAARLLDPSSLVHTMQQAGVTSDDAPDKLFAEVYKDGKLVASLYNGGSSATYGKADGIITGADDPYDGGPKLAQWRANKIAAALGGTVKLASTAQTQSQWEISYAAGQAKRDQALASYRAALNADRP